MQKIKFRWIIQLNKCKLYTFHKKLKGGILDTIQKALTVESEIMHQTSSKLSICFLKVTVNKKKRKAIC